MNNNIIDQITNVARMSLPKDSRLVLFGSRARGDNKKDSDWDLLVLLNKEKRENSDFDLVYPLIELGYDLHEEINPVLYTMEEWKDRAGTLFYHFVEKEGIELCH